MQNRYNRNNRRKYNLKVHIVLVTKYRKQILVNGIDSYLKKTCECIAKQHCWSIIAMETDKDHIHILLEYDTAESVSKIIGAIKQLTTYQMWKSYTNVLQKHYWKQHILWSDGYFACSIGEVSAATIQNYINSQG